jgi:hypothetical protein
MESPEGLHGLLCISAYLIGPGGPGGPAPGPPGPHGLWLSVLGNWSSWAISRDYVHSLVVRQMYLKGPTLKVLVRLTAFHFFRKFPRVYHMLFRGACFDFRISA